MSQKKKYSLLLVLVFFVACVTLRYPCAATASNALASSGKFSLAKLPIRSLQSLLPPHGMKPLVPEPPVTLLDRPFQPQVRTLKQTTPKTHRVQPGETLSKIARQYYGSVKQWKKIYQANQNILTNPNSLRTGMVLVIP